LIQGDAKKMNYKALILKYRKAVILVVHLLLIIAAYMLSFLLRFDYRVPREYVRTIITTLPALILIKLIIFNHFGLFTGLWRYVNVDDTWKIIKASFFSTLAFIIGVMFIHNTYGYPRSIFLLDWIVCTGLVTGVRFATRLFREKFKPARSIKTQRVLIVGAGEAGVLVLRESKHNPALGMKVVGFIDDSPVKKKLHVQGVKILGARKDIPSIVEEKNIDEIIIAIPSAKGETIREIISYCQIPEVKVKIVPGLNKILNGDLEIKPRDVRSEDLLGRETVNINKQEIASYIKDKKILVTGAGGSIGSELCRQIISLYPKEIILFDHNENDVYFLLIEFKTKYPKVKIKTVIGDIKDIGLLKRVFSSNRPQVVFHAAAHKHVPLLEDNPAAAVKNNIIGSRNLIYASNHYGVEKFVLISTDKAVNPINVMGMSKRIAEMILQAKSKDSKTKFMAVRFGNVIGSSGSVVPLFKRQIEEGGPVTITHPDTERYFMSVTEAALLVLQAGAIGKGGELFILDMGEQIKIFDIAKNLIALSGFTIHKDMAVKFIGLRPGEKISEELLLDREKDKVTKHNKIFVSQSEEFNRIKLHSQIKELEKLCKLMREDEIVENLKEIISSHSLF